LFQDLVNSLHFYFIQIPLLPSGTYLKLWQRLLTIMVWESNLVYPLMNWITLRQTTVVWKEGRWKYLPCGCKVLTLNGRT